MESPCLSVQHNVTKDSHVCFFGYVWKRPVSHRPNNQCNFMNTKYFSAHWSSCEGCIHICLPSAVFCSLSQSDKLVKMTICISCVCVLCEREGEGGVWDCQFDSPWALIGALFSLASCRRPCRSRLPQCPQGPASPLGWWASPKPGRCNCAGVSHSPPSRICVGCIEASVDAFICLAK